jgi:hypothetical protein
MEKQKQDYFAPFRPLFRRIVESQKADAGLKVLHIHFPAPSEEVAQVAKIARMIIDEGPGENNDRLFMIPFLMFCIKMFDGIVDKSVEPLLLDFTATEEEHEHAIMSLEIIIDERSHGNESLTLWIDTLILLHSFLERLKAGNC